MTQTNSGLAQVFQALQRPPVCRRDNYALVLLWGQGKEYKIDYNRLNSAPKVLGWIMQLTSKSWCTKEHLEQVVLAAADCGRVSINYSM